MKVVTILLLVASCTAFRSGVFFSQAPPTSTFNIRGVVHNCPTSEPPPAKQILSGKDVSMNSILECLKSYPPHECSGHQAPRLSVNLVEGESVQSPAEEKINAIVTFYAPTVCKGKIYAPPSVSGSSPLAIPLKVFSSLPSVKLNITTSHGNLFLITKDGLALQQSSIALEGPAAEIRSQLAQLTLVGGEGQASIVAVLSSSNGVIDSATLIGFLQTPVIVPGNGTDIVNTGNTTLTNGTYTNVDITGGTLNVAAGDTVVFNGGSLDNTQVNVQGTMIFTGTLGSNAVFVLQPGSTLIVGEGTVIQATFNVDGGVLVILGASEGAQGATITLSNGGQLEIGGQSGGGGRRSARAGTLVVPININQANNGGAVIIHDDTFDLVRLTGQNVFRNQLRTDTIVEIAATSTFETTASINLGPGFNLAKAQVMVTGTMLMTGPPGPQINVRTVVQPGGRLQGVGTFANVELRVRGTLAVGPGTLTANGPVILEATSTLVIVFAGNQLGLLVVTGANALQLQVGFQVVFNNAGGYTAPLPIVVVQPNGKLGVYPPTVQQLGGRSVQPVNGAVPLQYVLVTNTNTGGDVVAPTPAQPTPPIAPTVASILSPSKPVEKKSSSKIAWIIPIALGGTLLVFIIIVVVVLMVIKKQKAAAAAAATNAAMAKDPNVFSPAYPPAPPVTPYPAPIY